MSRRNEQMSDYILISSRHPHAPGAATTLRFVSRRRGALHISGMRDGDHYILILNQIFEGEFYPTVNDLSATFV